MPTLAAVQFLAYSTSSFSSPPPHPPHSSSIRKLLSDGKDGNSVPRDENIAKRTLRILPRQRRQYRMQYLQGLPEFMKTHEKKVQRRKIKTDMSNTNRSSPLQGVRLPWGMSRRTQSLHSRLVDILCRDARKRGISIRPDGFVLVDDLATALELGRTDWFHRVSPLRFLNMVTQESKGRFEVIQEENVTPLPESPWSVSHWKRLRGRRLYIRAKEGHNMQHVDPKTTPFTPQAHEEGVYSLQHESWKTVVQRGIPRPYKLPIEMVLASEGPLISSSTPASYYIYVSLARCVEKGIRFFKTVTGSLLTDGDERGIVPPEMITRVVKAERLVRTTLDKSEESGEWPTTS
ncbi:KptA family-domain-containing protein [Flagelloscypha sp. PMI_526]|nr:KptA family-domain-containing protein [Flagelloscypha sp. PMI_526]